MPIKEKSRLYLVKFCMDYCDEFDVQGFSVWNESDYQDYKDLYKSKCLNEDMVFYFGINECFEEYTVKDFLDSIEVIEKRYDLSAILEVFGEEYGLVTPTEIVNQINLQFSESVE